jgi:transcriptional regulator with AAA-type ATPase domain
VKVQAQRTHATRALKVKGKNSSHGRTNPAQPPSGDNGVPIFAELLVEKLGGGGPSAGADGLRVLLAATGAIGGVAGIIRESTFVGKGANPQILCAAGEILKTSDRLDLITFFSQFLKSGRERQGCVTAVLGDSLQFACCATGLPEDEVLGVVIWSDTRGGFEDLALLRIFTLLLSTHLRHGRGAPWPPPPPSFDEPKRFPPGYVVGKSDLMTILHHQLDLLSRGDFPVLVLGETGVGKEHIAHIIHSWSNRNRGPFVALNCAAIPAELLEAELFGIGRGVASGVLEREGYFQQADGGTLFLDEIGELQLPLQAKLLRVLQEKEIRRLGGATIPVDVRILAATNSDLRGRMADGGFRADLYYRVAGFELRVPPLRERKEDIAQLIEHFIKLYAEEAQKVVRGVALETLELLTEYTWPGNIRELGHELRRLVYLCPDNGTISADLLSASIRAPAAPTRAARAPASLSLLLEPQLEEVERRLILQALALAKGNQTRAARMLGVSRNGLALKLQRLGIIP